MCKELVSAKSQAWEQSVLLLLLRQGLSSQGCACSNTPATAPFIPGYLEASSDESAPLSLFNLVLFKGLAHLLVDLSQPRPQLRGITG